MKDVSHEVHISLNSLLMTGKLVLCHLQGTWSICFLSDISSNRKYLAPPYLPEGEEIVYLERDS
jgi:hypothetical protein